MRIKNVVDGHGDYHGLSFHCPGCGRRHNVTHNQPPPGYKLSRYITGDTWTFNGNYELPTLGPSVLVRTGHYADGNRKECYCNFEERYPGKTCSYKCMICHSFVRDGKIQFLTDSTHHLAGQTVDLPDLSIGMIRGPDDGYDD